MKFALDTNAVIALMGRHRGFLARMRHHNVADFGLSSVVFHELYFGAYKGRKLAENVAAVDDLRLEVLDFDVEDARRAGQIRAALAARGTPIGPFDVLIAGQAAARGLTLITRNVSEFSRVDGLSIADWQGGAEA